MSEATLLEVALAGTATLDGVEPRLPEAVRGLLAGRSGDPPERALLLAAACGAALRVGATPPSEAPEAGPEAPALERALPDRVTSLLLALLQGERDLLPAVLPGVVRTKRVLPPAALERFLKRCPEELRETARPLLGSRGRWLAEQGAPWSWAAEGVEPVEGVDSLAARFETAPARERVGLLRALRERDPAAGRRALRATWTSEAANERRMLLEALAEGLGPDDVALLEQVAGQDRSSKVVEVARRLLVRTPSDLRERMVARAAGCLAMEQPSEERMGFLKKLLGAKSAALPGRLTVRSPDPLPDDWAADGVEALRRGSRFPGRSDRVIQVLAMAPPSEVVAALGVDAGALLAALGVEDDAVLLGLSEGALLHGEAEWVPRLWDRWRRMPEEAKERDRRGADAQGRLLDAMPREARGERILELMTVHTATDWWPPLVSWETTWPDALAERWLGLLGQHLVSVAAGASEKTSAALSWRGSLGAAAARLPSERLRAAREVPIPPRELAPSWAKALEEFTARVDLRLEIEEAVGRLG